MESASNKSALCQVSLPDFFNSVTGSTWASGGAQVQIAAGYHIFRYWLEKQSEELKLGFDYYFPIS